MGIRVLVVDDDKDLLNLIERFLVKEQPDFKVVSTISAQDAVRKLEEEHFDAIVCDYYLGVGEMNGLELLEWLRASNSTIPFIMFTGRSREEVAIRALNLGADLYLKKDQEDLGNLFVELVHHIKSSVESVQVEKTLWEERSRFQKYLDVAGVMIVALDSDGTITLVNRSGCEILGYDSKEIIGKDWFKTFIPKSLRKEVHRAFTSLMKGDIEPAEYFENPILTKDGEERIIAWHNNVLTDASGMIIGALGSGEDVTERKKAEEALRESESRFRTIFEQAPMGVARVGLDGTILQGNNSLALMLGYDIDELVGINVFGISTPEDEKIERRFSQELLQGTRDSYEMEKRFIRKDGEEIWGILSVSVVSDSRGEPIFTIGMVENITPRKKAEEALRGSQQLLQRTFDGLSEAVLVLDADPVEIVDCNPAAETVFGYSRDEMLGQKISMLHIDEATYEEFKESLYLVIEEKGFLDRFEFRMKRKDGTVFSTELNVTPLMNEQGTRVGWVSVVRDVTERKKAEDALRESEKRFRAVFEQAAVGVTIVEIDDNIIEANPSYQKMVGYSTDELVTMKVADFTHPDDAAIDASLTREVLDGKRDSYTLEKRYIRKTGEEIWVKLSSNFVKDEEGIPEFCIGIVEDITERKKGEEALREREAVLNAIGQMAKVGGWELDAKTQEVSWTEETYRIHEVPLDQKPPLQDTINFYHPDEREKLTTAIKRALDHGEPYDMELRLITAKGKEIWTHSICKPQVINGKTVKLMGTFQDITDRKKAEQALRESEQRHRTLLQSMEDLVFVIDRSDCYSQYFSAHEDLLFVPPEEFLGKHLKDVLPPSISEEYLRCIQDVRHTGESVTLDYPLQIDEEQHWFSATISRHEDGESAVLVVRNITDRKRAEEALRESEARYRSLFDNTPVGLVVQEIVVDESGRPIDFVFIDANEGFEALMGLRKDDIIGKSASHVLTSRGELGLDWIDVYGKVALTGARARFDQYSEALGRWFSVTAYSPEKNFFIAAYTDITEQKQAYESLKQQKKELSDFAHTMSHDLNSCFFKIRGSILLLGAKGELPEIHGIKLLIEEMIDLVQHSVILADAGLTIDKKEKVDLARLVRDVAVRHLPVGIALVQGPLLSVMADEIKLLQVFQNLFKNAVEHGSPTTVEVQRYDSKEGVRIVVANDGEPIPNDLRPKIFQRGFTTKEKGKGFGLSIVKKLVEAHGWQIKLVDTPETAFEILIPAAAG